MLQVNTHYRTIVPIMVFTAAAVPGMLSLVIAPEVAWSAVILSVVVVIIAIGMLRRSRYKWPALVAILAYYLVVFVFALLSYRSSVAVGTSMNPYVPGGDGELYFAHASEIARSGFRLDPRHYGINYLGYPFLISTVFALFGINLFNGIAFNVVLLVVLLLLILRATEEMTSTPRAPMYAFGVAMLTPSFLAHGTLLLKDVVLMAALAATMYAAATFASAERRMRSMSVIIALVSLILVAVTRLPFVVFLPMVWIASQRKPIGVLPTIIFVGIAVAGYPVFSSFTTHSFDVDFVSRVAFSTSVVTSKLDGGGVTDILLAGYNQRPLPVRLLMLPVAVLVQFTMPFRFWSTAFLDDHSWYFITQQLHIVWLLLVGPVLALAVFRRGEEPGAKPIRRLMYIGVAIYLLIAFIYGGAIPRYATPGLVMMMPAAGLFVSDVRQSPAMIRRMVGSIYSYYIVGVFMLVLYVMR